MIEFLKNNTFSPFLRNKNKQKVFLFTHTHKKKKKNLKNMNNNNNNKSKNTVYLRNIPDSISKGELRQSLYELCTQYGVVLDIVAVKTERMRGQAFVVFRDEFAAASALQQLNGFRFYGNDLVCQYARKVSNATTLLLSAGSG